MKMNLQEITNGLLELLGLVGPFLKLVIQGSPTKGLVLGEFLTCLTRQQSKLTVSSLYAHEAMILKADICFPHNIPFV